MIPYALLTQILKVILWKRLYYFLYFKDEGSKSSQILSHVANKKHNKDLIQIFLLQVHCFSPNAELPREAKKTY